MAAARGQLSLQFMVIAPTVQIASLGMADSLILMVMALVVFGPRRLPQIGRQIGKLMYEFRKASNDFKFQMEEELRNSEEADRRKKEEERLRALALAAPAPATAPTTVDSEIPIAVPPVGDPGPWGPSETSAGETPNPAAGYDNGPVASTQIANTPVASTQEADTAPTIRPPSTGETVTATGPWSRQYEQAKAVEAAAATGSVPVKGATVDVPTSTANELPTSESSALESTASSPAKNESAARGNISSEAGSPEPVPEAAEPAASAVVNHHG